MAKLLLVLVAPLADRAPTHAPTRFADLAALAARTRSVDELVANLPSEMRENFTFVHDSRSPSAASLEAPRLVLFSEDARLVIAVSPKADSLEVIHFDDETAAFRTARITPPIVDSDPPECLHCHGADPRPPYDAYPFWPGFYGSVLDKFPPGSPELAAFRRFREKGAKEGIYRHLSWPRGSPVSPYEDPADYDPKQVERHGSLRLSPNTRLGMALTELNRKRIFRKLKSAPDYEKNKYWIASGLLNCNRLAVSAQALLDGKAELAREHDDAIARLGFRPSPDPGDFTPAFTVAAAEIDAAARLAGASRRDFALAFRDDSFALYDGILSGQQGGMNSYLKEDLLIELLSDIAKSDSRIRPHVKTYRFFRDQPFGARLDIPLARRACQNLNFTPSVADEE